MIEEQKSMLLWGIETTSSSDKTIIPIWIAKCKRTEVPA
jgi:hypothetical protein